MLKKQIGIAVRNIIRQYKSNSFSILGLCIAMACCIITAGWACYEYSYDRFNSNSGNIYQVYQTNRFEKSHYINVQPTSLGAKLKNAFPEIENYTTITDVGEAVVWPAGTGDITSPVELSFTAVDSSFFKLFDFTLVHGSKEAHFKHTNSVIITQKIASSLFPGKSALGETIIVGKDKLPLRVSGILADIPDNSSIKVDALVSPVEAISIMSSIYNYKYSISDWEMMQGRIFLLLNKSSNVAALNKKLENFLANTAFEDKSPLVLQNLLKQHLDPLPMPVMEFSAEKTMKISSSQIYLLIAVSILILSIACINFLNLGLATSIRRSKEFGIRRVLGATRKNLISIFFIETFIVSLFSAVVGLIIALFSLPYISILTGRELNLSYLPLFPFISAIIGFIVFTSVVSGLYPAIVTSLRNLSNVIGKQIFVKHSAFSILRKGLLSVQFACSGLLLFLTLIFVLQIYYIKNKDLGYDKENIAMIQFSAGYKPGNPDKLINDLRQIPGVKNLSCGMQPTFGKSSHKTDSKNNEITWDGKDPKSSLTYEFFSVDAEYAATFGLKLKEGRFYDKDRDEGSSSLVINETAANVMGLKRPVGSTVINKGKNYTIIGVVKDFHVATLKAPIIPHFFKYSPKAFWGLSMKIHPKGFSETISRIQKVWKNSCPELILNIKYLDEELALHYLSDDKLYSIILFYAFLSIVVACSGLSSIVILSMEEKRKEIGIRKILGASIAQINLLLNKRFIVLVSISALAVFPVGHIIASRWLENYSYRISISPLIYIASFGLLLCAAILTLLLNTTKVARTNPAESIRTE